MIRTRARLPRDWQGRRKRPWRAALPRSLVVGAALACVAGLAACAATPKPGAPAGGIPDWAEFRGLLVPRPLIPIEATGSVLFDYRGEQQSGNVLVRGNRQQEFLLNVTSRVLGTAALEVRLTRSELLVLDFGAETYFIGANDRPNRLKLFSIDMTPEEFLMVLTARVPRSAFAEGDGRMNEARAAEFHSGDAVYRFALDGEGLPVAWSKEEAGLARWRVEYREYQAVPMGDGTLRLPRKVRVYAEAQQPRLVLGIREFLFRDDRQSPAPLAIDPPAGLRFQPLEESMPSEDAR